MPDSSADHVLEAARNLERARQELESAKKLTSQRASTAADEKAPEIALLQDEVVDLYRRTVGHALELGARLPD